ncbi:hypothetical protein Celaphus_00013958 [Cervus elaphus hippelaphus]|uniref:Uncharacterized protein n=1 Tax=Cervus elaphus hippelaphus TaxID=46360 RepID=A0A212CCM7_CEREH|nr:hypothetical protein Celaphus_00013958 [Cervus elaphus hippelaphus]
MLLFPAVLLGHCWHCHTAPECLFYHQMCWFSQELLSIEVGPFSIQLLLLFC